MRRPIYHLALAADWEDARGSGQYERSTVGRSLEDQGFIHCSFGHQVQAIADLLYRGRSDVLLLQIEPDLLGAEIRVENLDGGTDLFPHVYGTLPISAVTRVDMIEADSSGRLAVADLLGPESGIWPLPTG